MKSEIIYSAQKTNFVSGHRYANPRLFNRPRQGVTSVIVVGEWVNVIEAYKMAGVPVRVLGDEEELLAFLTGEASESEPASSQAPPIPVVHDEEPLLPQLPDEGDEEDLAWPVLKKLAEGIVERQVKSRAQAIEIIKDERSRRNEA